MESSQQEYMKVFEISENKTLCKNYLLNGTRIAKFIVLIVL